MYKQVSKTFVALAVLLLFMAGTGLHGQQHSVDIQEVKETSLASFEQGNFRLALTGFRTLMELDGTDPLYSYYVGRCLVELNEELDEAIELLYGASKKMCRLMQFSIWAEPIIFHTTSRMQVPVTRATKGQPASRTGKHIM